MRRLYRPANTLALVVSVLLILEMVLVIPAAWSNWELIQFLDIVHRAQAAPQLPGDDDVREAGREAVNEQEAERIDKQRGLVGLAALVVHIPLVIVFAMWIYRTNSNAHALGAQRMEFTPGWSVGWYFIPIANLFKPYQAMKETWKATQAPAYEDWRQAPSWGLLPLWWFLWIVNGILGQAAFRLSWRAETLEQIRFAAVVDMVSDGASLPLALVALLLVRCLTAMQEENYQLREQNGWPKADLPQVTLADDAEESPMLEDSYPSESHDRPYQ